MNAPVDQPPAGIRMIDLIRLLPGPVASMRVVDQDRGSRRMHEAMAHPLFAARGMVSRQVHPSEGAVTALVPSVKLTA